VSPFPLPSSLPLWEACRVTVVFFWYTNFPELDFVDVFIEKLTDFDA
jgi:hypothetical protein